MRIRIITAITALFTLSCFASDNLSLAMKLYSSQRAFRVGDLVTIMVAEETSASKSESHETDKSATSTMTEGTIGGGIAQGAIFKDPRAITPPLNLNGNSKFSGSGQTSSSESLKASYTARVVDVLPNDVLVIRGERSVTKNGEKIDMVLTGSIRRQDILANNTIDSSKMSDARIFYKTSGEVSRGSQPGWLWRFFQFINPF